MKLLKAKIISILSLLLLIVCDISFAADNVTVSNELTNLFRAARKVVSVNQAHINTQDIGDKGLSADVVAKKTLDNYKAATGKTMKEASMSAAQKAMIDAVKQVMNDNQDLINEQGVGLKGFLPAIFAKAAGNAF